MKKYLTISALALLALGTFTSCTRDVVQEVQVDYPTVYDVKGVNFTNANGYSYYQAFSRSMLDQDYVMMYRQDGIYNGNNVWEPIPKTIYLNDDNEVNYDFTFTKKEFEIYFGSTDAAATTNYSLNQNFRIVLVPAVKGKGVNTDLSKMSYDEVIQRYKIDDSKVVNLK